MAVDNIPLTALMPATLGTDTQATVPTPLPKQDSASAYHQDTCTFDAGGGDGVPADGLAFGVGVAGEGGTVNGADGTLWGARAEWGQDIVSGGGGALAAVASGALAVGSGALASAGLGLRLKLALGDNNALYGSAQATANTGYSRQGATAGVGVRTAVGVESEFLYLEYARHKATNLDTQGASVGLHFNY